MLGAFSGECLNAISCSSEGLVAIGGAERVVLVMDPLKWVILLFTSFNVWFYKTVTSSGAFSKPE
jgi:hypothetical protein